YGFYALNKEALGLQHAELLLDAKTIDEGQYEFEKGFETGADILTVMGAASQGTLETTYKVAERYGRQMFI
ncbi:orotidine 5'-phosphate decarboxylase, partial [Bifidobacterium longum]|nr:orotidine 5'-phosphate decarboxylase [Bifidobacterium longum]